jgi:aryl-alcohol dehydrogenase-like predicted oxidoreductase
LGILPFGTKVDRETGFALLDAYFEAGGRFIDTANNYSKWHAGGVGTESETTLGAWMRARNNRNELTIATKVGFNRDDRGLSLSSNTIALEIEGSLDRLGTDHVDLYYAHGDIRKDPLEESLESFNRIVRSGKARAIGCSNYRAWRIEQARDISKNNAWAEYCCCQQRHSYLRPKPGAAFGLQVSSNDDLLDYARERGDFRLLAFSPLLKGSYTRGDRPTPPEYAGPDSDARLAMLKQVSEECGATANQVVYAWMLQGQGIIPLTAPTTLEQLRENLGGLKVVLSKEQIDRLDKAGA